MRRLSDLGDQLEACAATVDFERFRGDPEAALAYSDGAKGGRPPYDPVLMFKACPGEGRHPLVIQAQNNLSDERTEFLIKDRLSFMRFLGLSLGDRVPDAKTIWLLARAAGARGCARGFWTKAISAPRCGPIAPIAPRPMSGIWKRTALPAASTARSRRASRCRSAPRA